MSKKRGLSLEEKRERMMQIFYETKSFFQLKDLEKIAQKEKGITSMSVKEVLQSLVDDNMVDTERIGTSNYFWAYPSKVFNIRRKNLEDLIKLEDGIKKKIEFNNSTLSYAKKGKEDSDERTQLLLELSKLEKENKTLGEQLAQYKDCDPEVLNQVKEEATMALEATNRWTDNIFQVKKWCKDKFNIETSQIDKQFGIPQEMDYVEE